MADIKIVVASHREHDMPKDPMYLPLYVGASLRRPRQSVSKNTDDNADGNVIHKNALQSNFETAGTSHYVFDNTGENISDKNETFCELTGLYWAWKNLDNEYIGLVHYRRFFAGKNRAYGLDRCIGFSELSNMTSRYDIFLPKKQHYLIETLRSHYAHTHYASHVEEAEKILYKNYCDHIEDFEYILNRRSGYMFNMIVMRRDRLDDYCRWLFDILFRLEDVLDLSGLSDYQKRAFGRISELLLNTWIRHQIRVGNIRANEIKELDYFYLGKVDWVGKTLSFLKAKFLHEKYERSY